MTYIVTYILLHFATKNQKIIYIKLFKLNIIKISYKYFYLIYKSIFMIIHGIIFEELFIFYVLLNVCIYKIFLLSFVNYFTKNIIIFII